MSHTTSSTRRAAAQRLLLETTLFQEETSLPRLQALLTTLEDQPPPAFSAEASWRQLQATHPDCFPLRRARAWRRWALAGSAAALAALVLLLPAQTKESTALAPALSQDTVSQVCLLYTSFSFHRTGVYWITASSSVASSLKITGRNPSLQLQMATPGRPIQSP